MIIDTSASIAANDILAAKLVSGEEIVAKVIEVNDKEFVIVRPMAMTIVPQGNSATVAFMPWTLGIAEDAKIRLVRTQIIAYSKARKEAADGYIRNTSNIIPAAAIPGLGR